ncbi:MAG: hypothetical protein COV36_03585 [Alphaproteobacteria bacterium CG11_big_fil_rev_8_21_14_0_20_44_7]|nr:MAG: hypothetical protein COV36_03585 [Alphaproteobacteria bacterium CG11_big_fil_rev_8_21_14_0_20_44_7]
MIEFDGTNLQRVYDDRFAQAERYLQDGHIEALTRIANIPDEAARSKQALILLTAATERNAVAHKIKSFLKLESPEYIDRPDLTMPDAGASNELSDLITLRHEVHRADTEIRLATMGKRAYEPRSCFRSEIPSQTACPTK